MLRKTEAEQIKGIRTYYQESETAYNNWGRDLTVREYMRFTVDMKNQAKRFLTGNQ